jgi:glutamate---cysteine ligase / carboxylate-amine ligase
VFEAAGADARVKPELMKSVIEVATHVADSAGRAVEEAAGLRARLRDAARREGALIASAGTHPFSRYRHQEITEQPRYRELVDEMRWVADRGVIFGLHVHVGMESADQAVAVCNGLRTHLPELLALSANSPFWQGRDTGISSTRSKIFDSFPRSGLPPALVSFQEFESLVERGARTGSFPDYTFIWWDLRPHPKLGTIEVRVCDGQTRLESLAGLLALVQSLAATLAERYESERALPTQPRTLIAENKWRAARSGLEADLIDLERDRERPAREAVLALVELARPAASRLGCAAELAEVERLCERGDGATEQRRVYEETSTMLGVSQWLVAETAAGL